MSYIRVVCPKCGEDVEFFVNDHEENIYYHKMDVVPKKLYDSLIGEVEICEGCDTPIRIK
jgi:hypothetical protein